MNSPAAFRFMTYNIKSGLHHARGLEAVAEVIEAARPDVVALQEVDRGTRRAGERDQTEWLRRRLGFVASAFGDATSWPGGGDYGLAILSRFPTAGSEIARLYTPATGQAPASECEPRIALAVRVDVAGLSVSILSVHLGLSQAQRLRQGEQVVTFATDFAADGPCLIGGDFNAVPGAQEMRPLRHAFDDALDATSEAGRASFPSRCMRGKGDAPAVAIDYVFTTPDVRATASVVHDDRCASDHDPVVADCVLLTT